MSTETLEMSGFLTQYGPALLDAVNRQNPPIYQGDFDVHQNGRLDQLLRTPFDRQREAIHAISKLLIDQNEPAGVLNGEMGTGKTMMAIAVAKLLHDQGYPRCLVICPPHLVYKWRREILETVPNANVMVLNGPDSLVKLIALREALGQSHCDQPQFYVMGRVRMRMGFHWRLAINQRRQPGLTLASCPDCGTIQKDEDGEVYPFEAFNVLFRDKRRNCQHCETPLWTLMHRTNRQALSKTRLVEKAMCQIPTIGPKTAQKLINTFGVEFIENMLVDNIYEFINLMDHDGELVFSDKQATRMERSMAKIEFGLGQGDYQPTEFIKRYLPNRFFGVLLADEAHEYKNQGSAQGQAMGVLANKVSKTLLLTGTLMGGYADDLFYLLWRIHRKSMIDDGYVYNDNNSLGTAAMAFMREHGILKDVYKESTSENHRTAKGKKYNVTTSKAPGFGPKGITRYVLPYTVFVRLSEMGKGVLPDYNEFYENIDLNDAQTERYSKLSASMKESLNEALRKGDRSLLGLVINLLLRWPETCFNGEVVKHPNTRDTLAVLNSVIDEITPLPKEQALIDRCLAEKAQGRKTLVYTVYSGTRDTTTRLKSLLDNAGLKTAVLRASVSTEKREDWIADQVDRGIDVLITNPELVKTGLDLYDFPTLVFMQTGYNVYSLQQASRRSWRIGQTQDVKVYFFGYANTAQIDCLSLMAKKIAVSNSTSGVMPETGLDVLNQETESIEVQLAKRILHSKGAQQLSIEVLNDLNNKAIAA